VITRFVPYEHLIPSENFSYSELIGEYFYDFKNKITISYTDGGPLSLWYFKIEAKLTQSVDPTTLPAMQQPGNVAQPMPQLQSSVIQKKRLDVSGFAKVTAQHFLKDGGGTGAEYPQNLVSGGEEPYNKWYQNSSSSSWVMVEFAQAITFSGLGLKSANDCPHRDPDEGSVFIFNPCAAGWEKIADLKINFSQTRWEVLQFPEVQATNLRSFIIDLKNSKASEMQLGEIVFY
jgi:hypothetical protein